MRIAIDATNIRTGGGVTHLCELLRAADPAAHGIDRIIVWACRSTLEKLDDRPWLDRRWAPALEQDLFRRSLWQRRHLRRLIEADGASLLFAPGGSILVPLRPAVTMCQNMLPFEWGELWRFGISSVAAKLVLLRLVQSRSFRRANGTIFLTEYAAHAVQEVIGRPLASTIIPHGVADRFRHPGRTIRAGEEVTPESPLRVLYASTIDHYKHQWVVAEAVARLRAEGVPIRLDLYGEARPSALRRLRTTLARIDPEGRFVLYHGAVDPGEIHRRYTTADLVVFASSCENMPNNLLEGMAAGLPIACSDRGPMPRMLGDAGLYFDPEDVASIADALRAYAGDAGLRARKARAAAAAAAAYSWQRCAHETMAYLAAIAREAERRSGSRSSEKVMPSTIQVNGVSSRCEVDASGKK